MAQINDDEFFAGVELSFEFVDRDARDAQFVQKAPARDEFVGDVGREDSQKKNQEPAAQSSEMLGYALDLSAKYKAQAEESASPEERSHAIEQQEAARTHVKDASEGSRDSAQAGEKLGQHKGASALLRKKALGAANAGIRLKRNLAEKLENPNAFAAAKLIPDGIRCHRRQHHEEKRGEEIQVAGARERACCEQQRHRGNRQTYLLGEDPTEQQSVTVMEQKFESTVHGWVASGISVISLRKEQYAPTGPP